MHVPLSWETFFAVMTVLLMSGGTPPPPYVSVCLFSWDNIGGDRKINLLEFAVQYAHQSLVVPRYPPPYPPFLHHTLGATTSPSSTGVSTDKYTEIIPMMRSYG